MVDEKATTECSNTDGQPEEQWWRFWSTRDSIEHDIPSVSAVIETLLAVPAFWWLAGTSGFYLPLMISMAVAPLVLLRSEESVELGLRWFLKWHGRKGTYSVGYDYRQRLNMPPLNFVAHLTIVLGGGSVLIAAIPMSLDRLLLPLQAQAWLKIVLAVWLAVFTYSLATAVLIAFASLFISRMSVAWLSWRGYLLNLAYTSMQGGVAGLALAAASSGAEATGEVIATIIGLLTGVLISTLRAITLRFVASGRSIPALIILSLPQIILDLTGILSSALFLSAETALIRIAATARHLPKGLEALPRNFRRLVISTSPAQLPELIPGLIPGKTSLLWFTLPDTLSYITELRRRAETPKVWVALVSIQTALIFLPAWFYRITLKSTAWFWWPLTLLGGDVKHLQDPGLHYEWALKSLWGITTIILSLATITSFVFTNLIATGGIFQSNPLLNTLGYLLLVDWSAPPWQLLSVFSAGLSLFIVFRLDYVFREYRYATKHGRDEILSRTKRKFFVVELAGRARLLSALAFWTIVGCHTFLYLNSLDCWVTKIPSAVEVPARVMYGNRLPPLSCVRPIASKSTSGHFGTGLLLAGHSESY
jgi:hypothetical protein